MFAAAPEAATSAEFKPSADDSKVSEAFEQECDASFDGQTRRELCLVAMHVFQSTENREFQRILQGPVP